MPTPEFNNVFKNNFYLTREWADFCSKVTNIKLSEKTISKQKVFLLKKKNLSISNYSNKFSEEMKDNKISFMRVLPHVNNQSENPSFIEYAIFHKKSYEKAVKDYKRSFRDALKQGEKYPHTTKIIKDYNNKIIYKVYDVYISQMKRLNSAIFSFSFFEHLMKSPSSLLFILEHEKEIISYSFCFQYEDNLYASIGGSNPDFFKLRASNKLYNELIKYCCENNLNMHLGIGEKDAGFNLFKEKAGALNYKCERHPNDEWMIKMLMPFLKSKLVGKILQFISKKSPEKVVYIAMPFT